MATIGMYPIIKSLIQYSHSYLNEGLHNLPTGGEKKERETLHIVDRGMEAETMTVELLTLLKVVTKVGGLDRNILLETRDVLQEEIKELNLQW